MTKANGGLPRTFPGRAGATYDIRLWKIGKARSKTRPHMLRWVVAGTVKTETFGTYALADSRRAELLQAMRRGEAFDIESGLPESMFRARQRTRSWFNFCCAYVESRWQSAAAKTRDAVTDSLATATLALVESGRGRPGDEDLRRAFRWAVIPSSSDRQCPADLAEALCWLRRSSLPMSALTDAATVDRVLYALTRTLSGRAAAGDTARRRRRGLNAALEYAADNGELPFNPLKGKKTRRVAASDRVDKRVVVSLRQAQQLLVAVSYVGSWSRARGRRLVAFFAVLYYAGMRPAEAVALREGDCYLPAEGWGRLTLAKTRPAAGRQYTDNGEYHDERGLKGRDPDEQRVVPIPPVLVRHLRDHIAEFGATADGRLFRNERGGILGTTTYSRAWEEARCLALAPPKVASPLAGRPYDLRHAAITLWLNSGVPVAEVARRVGNSIEVIHRRYQGCVDDQEGAINMRIQAAIDQEE